MLSKLVKGISFLIVVLCALNIGIMGLTDLKVNLMTQVSGIESTAATKVIYIIIGIAGLISLIGFLGCFCKKRRSGECCSKSHSCGDQKN